MRTYKEALDSNAPEWVKRILRRLEKQRELLEIENKTLRGDVTEGRVVIEEFSRPPLYLPADDVSFDLTPPNVQWYFKVRAKVMVDQTLRVPILRLNSDPDGFIVVPTASNTVDIRRRDDWRK